MKRIEEAQVEWVASHRVDCNLTICALVGIWIACVNKTGRVYHDFKWSCSVERIKKRAHLMKCLEIGRIHLCIIKYPLGPFSTGNAYAELTSSRFNRCVAFLPWQAGHHVKTWTVGHWAVRFRSFGGMAIVIPQSYGTAQARSWGNHGGSPLIGNVAGSVVGQRLWRWGYALVN